MLDGILKSLFVGVAKYPNVSVGSNILEMRRVVSVPSGRVMEFRTMTHIGVMYYLNASPSTLMLPSTNCLITSTGNAGIVTVINLYRSAKRNQD